MRKFTREETDTMGIKEDRWWKLVSAKRCIAEEEQSVGGTLTNEEKIVLLMDWERKQKLKKINSVAEGFITDTLPPEIERKLYLNAKYLLYEVETHLSPKLELTPELADSTNYFPTDDEPTMQNMVEEAVIKIYSILNPFGKAG